MSRLVRRGGAKRRPPHTPLRTPPAWRAWVSLSCRVPGHRIYDRSRYDCSSLATRITRTHPEPFPQHHKHTYIHNTSPRHHNHAIAPLLECGDLPRSPLPLPTARTPFCATFLPGVPRAPHSRLAQRPIELVVPGTARPDSAPRKLHDHALSAPCRLGPLAVTAAVVDASVAPRDAHLPGAARSSRRWRPRPHQMDETHRYIDSRYSSWTATGDT